MDREQLHCDAENYYVWCERCQKVHLFYTFTREDFDRVIADGVAAIAKDIDARELAYVMTKLN